MSEYSLRAAFPLNDKHFVVGGKDWICRLVEVSDLRPAEDRLSWYLVFETDEDKGRAGEEIRKLEIVTGATHVLANGWRDDLPDRLVEWLLSGEQDSRLEWLDE